jgi:hypothetical protein
VRPFWLAREGEEEVGLKEIVIRYYRQFQDTSTWALNLRGLALEIAGGFANDSERLPTKMSRLKVWIHGINDSFSRLLVCLNGIPSVKIR